VAAGCILAACAANAQDATQKVSVFGNNGTASLSMAVGTADVETTAGGTTLTRVVGTTCTLIKDKPGVVHKTWAAGRERATLSIFTDRSCSTPLWSGVPSTIPLSFDAPVGAIYYRLNQKPAADDYITTS
jgi:hypothetical protein